MRLQALALLGLFAPLGCIASTADEDSSTATQAATAAAPDTATPASTPSVLYMFATPTDPTATAPLALRRANAVPSTLQPTYGEPVLPSLVLASDATSSQAALDAVIASPYATEGSDAVALLATRDGAVTSTGPSSDVVTVYTPSQTVPLSAVAQRDALYKIAPASNGVAVTLVNEKTYSSSNPAFDYSQTVDPAAAAAAVQAGAFFTGTVDVKCSTFLFWTTCKAPTAVHVSAYFTAR